MTPLQLHMSQALESFNDTIVMKTVLEAGMSCHLGTYKYFDAEVPGAIPDATKFSESLGLEWDPLTP
jgi:hypothetical protein